MRCAASRALGVVAIAIAVSALAHALAPGPTRPVEHGAAAEEEDELEGLAGREKLTVNPRGVLEASFTQESYRPRDTAVLRVFRDAQHVSVRIFRVGPERIVTRRPDMMFGVEVAGRRVVASIRAGGSVRLSLGDWPSGLYFARLSAPHGRLGFAPFVVAPSRLGGHRVAVVMPTNTWLAYNVRDDDGDGIGDSWYADPDQRSVATVRPFLSRGVPFRFRGYDLPFLRWLDRHHKEVDVLSDRELDRTTGAELYDAYRLVVFPGHHEYVTRNEYDAIERFRDLGGNLAFLSANNLFWEVERSGTRLTRIARWRDLGRPEASLVGVQYIANDAGEARGRWLVRSTPAVRWLLEGTDKRPGDGISNGGIEIDAVASSSPPGTSVVAEIPDLFGPGLSAQMSYYETPRGAHVFAAGAFTLAGASFQPDVSRMLENLWARLTAELPAHPDRP